MLWTVSETEGRDWETRGQNLGMDLGHRAQKGTRHFTKTSLHDMFPAQGKTYATGWLVLNKKSKIS